MQQDIIINRLPAMTWHGLGMNETKLTIEQMKNAGIGKPEKIPEGVTWKKEPLLTKIETGMGKELELLQEKRLQQAYTIHIDAGVDCKDPIILQYVQKPGEDIFEQLQIIAEEKSNITVILVYSSTESGTATFAHQTKVEAKTEANVHLYTAQLLDDKVKFLEDFGVYCSEHAKITIQQMELGAGKLYVGALAELSGAYSSFQSDIGYQAEDGAHLDLNYVARHIGRKTQSDMKAGGVLKEHAFKLFRGTIDFKTGCKEAVGKESEDVLLLGENVINQTIPLILCGEEDVEGSHGASIGQLDEQVLFYLKSRGFSTEAVEKMITRARMEALCQQIPSKEVQKQVETYLEVKERDRL